MLFMFFIYLLSPVFIRFCVNVYVLATGCELNCPLGTLKIFQFNSVIYYITGRFIRLEYWLLKMGLRSSVFLLF